MAEGRRSYGKGSGGPPRWDAARLLSLRKQLGLSQQELANELGVRQQTVSEWETGVYRPRGASVRMIGIVAERAGFTYGTHRGAGERDAGEASDE